MSYEPRISTLAAALLAAFGTTIQIPVQAAMIIVTDTGDSGSASTCTLRQAIVSMNAGAVAGTGCTYSGPAFGSSDTIAFSTTAFPNGSANNTITLASGPLSITAANLAIEAAPNGSITIDAHQASPVMVDSVSGGSLSLDHLSLTNGAATTGFGGGIGGSSTSRLTLTHSTLSGNSASLGGGIYGGYVTLTNCTLSGNSANYGGGIWIRGASNVTGSTLSGNSASKAGGGIYTVGALTLTNSTLSGNSAQSSTLGGGGIFVGSSNSLTLTNVTISANSAVSYGAGIFGNGQGQVAITANNSIVAGNTSLSTLTTADVYPGITTGLDDLIGSNPKLGPLANNGGPTRTMLPLPGSPAIDNGNDATCAASPVNGVDQRGVPRPQGARCDIGAVETDTIFANGFE